MAKMFGLNDDDAPPLILNDPESAECDGLADALREMGSLIRAGTRPALDRVVDLERAAELLEKVYIAHHPPKHVCPGESCEAWTIMRNRFHNGSPSEESAFIAGWHIANE